MTHGGGLVTHAVLRLLAAMDQPWGDEETEAVRDGGVVWVGCERYKAATLRKAIQLCALRDVSDGGGMERYEINATGRAILADPSQADALLRLLYSNTPSTVVEGKIVALADPEEMIHG